MATRPRKQQLKVVFDTNVLFTQVASDLLRNEIVEAISQHTQHADLAITWHLPKVVRDEREYQMNQRAGELLPALEKLERVLGHQLGISGDILKQRIVGIIEKQIEALKLEVLLLDCSKVDWVRLSQDAAFRRPPFDPGQKEKGFRDALIVESFLQLVDASPSTPKTCRLVLLTDDQLMTEAVGVRTEGRQNVSIFQSVEELKGFINTLVSNASEEFVASIRLEAGKLFYDFEKEEGLYKKWDISKKLTDDFKAQMAELPPGGISRSNTTRRISPPQFVKKDGKQMHWLTRIGVETQSLRKAEPSSQPQFDLASLAAGVANPPLSTGFSTSGTTATAAKSSAAGLLARALLAAGPNVAHKKGMTNFDVAWSATVNRHKKLLAPILGGITCIGTTWE